MKVMSCGPVVSLSLSLILLLPACQAGALKGDNATPSRESAATPSPTNVAGSATPGVMTLATIRVLANASDVPPQILILTGVAQTSDAARQTPRPPSFFWTTTPDLRPTATPDFGGFEHRWTEAGVIFPRWPEDFALVCFKFVEAPEGLAVNNYWSQWDGPDRKRVNVYAGATAVSLAAHRASVMVAYKWDPCVWDEYAAPEPTGPLEITDEKAHVLQLRSEDKTYYFDIDLRSFVAGYPVSVPSDTPDT